MVVSRPPMMMQTLKVGDIAVYPAHGVAEVTGIERREVAGRIQQFYVLRMLAGGMTIMVPTGNTESVRLRQVMAKDEVQEVYGILKSRPRFSEGPWNRRYRAYMDKIRTGSPVDLAEVLRDLTKLRDSKELSFGERKMLETARTLLVKELAVAKRRAERTIEREIDQILA